MGIAFIAFFFTAIFFVLFYAGNGSGRSIFNPGIPIPVETPLEVLKKRYAREEIDRDKFEKRRPLLRTMMDKGVDESCTAGTGGILTPASALPAASS